MITQFKTDQIHLVGQYIIIRVKKIPFNVKMTGNTFVSKANEKSATKHSRSINLNWGSTKDNPIITDQTTFISEASKKSMLFGADGDRTHAAW